MTSRARLWLTPATAVIALAVAGVTAGLSWRGGGAIREWAAKPEVSAPATASPAPTYTVPGSIRLPAGQYVTEGQTCRGSTVREDAQVVVTDRTGATLTYAQVGAGKVADGACELPFTLVMPVGAGEYGIDFPQYGLLPYTEQEIADLLELTIG